MNKVKMEDSSREYIGALIEFSEKEVIMQSAFELDVAIEDISIKTLDYATQIIESRTGVKYDTVHKKLSISDVEIAKTNSISKKGNMAYWDEIDNLAEEFVKDITNLNSVKLNSDELLEIGKEVTEFATSLLQKELGATYPYVEGDY